MNQNVLYNLIFESDPSLVDLTESTIRGFSKVLFIDSIFDFFPRVEVGFRDPTGIIPDRTYFIEDLEFNIKLGNNDVGFLGGNYVWAINEFNDVRIDNFLSGNNFGIFISKYINKEQPQNKSWLNTIKGVIEDKILTDYSIADITKKFISNTIGADYWYQSCKKNSTFIQDLTDYAFDIAHSKSPFYSFINSNEEFYFMHLYDLFTQSPINIGNPYVLEITQDTMTNPYGIRDYVLQYPGMEQNFENYKIKSYNTQSTGLSLSDTYEYKDFVYKELGSKLLLRSQYNNINTILYAGINETTQDDYNYKGLVNSLYRDSALTYRQLITIPFNPKVVCGKLIEIKVNSAFAEKGILNEFSGNWLVCKTLHHINMDGLAYSNILIAKSTIKADSKHKFYPDFQ